jgi:hypothetical protein
VRYAYQTPDGQVHWLEQRLADGSPPKFILVGEVQASRCYRAERKGGNLTGWPLECEASGVMPEQAAELRAEFRRLGLDVEVSPQGNPVYTSPASRRKALKARGFYDRSSYA